MQITKSIIRNGVVLCHAPQHDHLPNTPSRANIGECMAAHAHLIIPYHSHSVTPSGRRRPTGISRDASPTKAHSSDY
jgi:hypothetical protein